LKLEVLLRQMNVGRFTWSTILVVAMFSQGCGRSEPGPAGPKGDQGDAGAPGTVGADGDDGAQGDAGFMALFRSSVLEMGDADCAAGGTSISGGLDNGDGGGVAGDGTLQPGEVDQTYAICNGLDALVPLDHSAPLGADGTNRLDAGGGSGVRGGYGGRVQIRNEYANGGHVGVWSKGAVDAGFEVPDGELGAPDAYVVSTDITITTTTDSSVLTANPGVLYLLGSSYFDGYYTYNSFNFAVADASGNLTYVDDLEIAAGADVVVSSDLLATYVGYTSLYVTSSIVVLGSLTFEAPTAGAVGDLDFYTGALHVGPAGSVVIEAANTTNIDVNLSQSFFNGLQRGVFLNEGTFRAESDETTDGIGYLQIEAQDAFYNLGTISWNETAGTGSREGGDLEIYGYNRIYNSGTVDVSGVAGNTVGGGDGGYLYAYAAMFKNTGEWLADGAPATAACTDGYCAGGDGGEIEIYAYQGLATEGLFSAAGADGALDGKDPYGTQIDSSVYNRDAGYGGRIWLELDGGEIDTDHLWFGASADVSGGDGDIASDGGEITIVGSHGRAANQSVWILGVDEVDVGGGDASGLNSWDYAGYAGYIAYNNAYYTNYYGDDLTGGIYTDASANLRGGDATTGSAGGGGEFEASVSSQVAGLGDAGVWIGVDFDLSAGAAGAEGSGSDGGEVHLGGVLPVTVQNVVANGSDGNYGGDGGGILVWSMGAVSVGDVTAEGGESDGGESSGGWGGTVGLVGTEIVAGAAMLDGGDATGTSSYGGDGGQIMVSGNAVTASPFASTSMAGGAGVAENGDDGLFYLNGFIQP
jgi:hypothetical protein